MNLDIKFRIYVPNLRLMKKPTLSFHITSILIILNALSSSTNANVASGKNSKIVYQIEAGFNLTEPLANRIKKSFKKDLTAQKRTDYYIDIYNGEKLLISESTQDYKVRLKAKKDKWVLQANTKLSVKTHSCLDGTSFKIREKNVGELNLSKAQASQIIQTTAKAFDLVEVQKFNDFADSVAGFDKFINSLKIPLFDQILEVTANENWLIVPSHMTQKIKWSSDKQPKTHIEWSLTEARDYISSNFVETKFEIEFQTEDPKASADDFANFICNFMSNLAPQGEELTPVRKDIDALIIQELSEARSYLEFHR